MFRSKANGWENLKLSPDASLTPGVFTHEQITLKCTRAHTPILTYLKPAYVLDESVGNKVHPHYRLMAAHPPRPSKQYSE